jgi:hypothetical protein
LRHRHNLARIPPADTGRTTTHLVADHLVDEGSFHLICHHVSERPTMLLGPFRFVFSLTQRTA